MTERIQNILAEQMAEARQGSDRIRLQGLKDLAKRVARANERGWFSQNASSLQTELITPELQTEWERDAQKLADFFAKLERKSEAEYMDSLPKPFAQPESYRGRFDIPLIVTVPTKDVPLAEMLKAGGISSYYDAGRTKDWEEDSYQTPDRPYFTWVSDGGLNLNKSVEDVRTSLIHDSRGGTLLDGIGVVIKNPDILKHHFLDLPGSQVGSGFAPFLDRWSERPRLYRHFVDRADPSFGSVVAGREIRT